MKLTLSLVALVAATSPLAAAVYSPADYGAVFGGASNGGAALQRAIDAAFSAGGGTVVVPAGKTLMSGSIELKSNVTLDLEPGSRLVGSILASDYTDSIFIRARHAQNVSITGSGTIDGRGLEFLGKEGP
jgi:polygalacturonase